MVISCFQSGIKHVLEAGFKNIFLDMKSWCSEYELELFGEEKPAAWNIEERQVGFVSEEPSELWKHIKAMEKALRKEGAKGENVGIPIARIPRLARDTRRADLNDLIKRIAGECLAVCGKAGCRYLIVPPLFAGVDTLQAWQKNREYYIELAEVAKKQNIMLLLENQCRLHEGHYYKGLCSDPYEAAAWIDDLNKACGEERFGFCLDMGTATVCRQDIQELIVTLGKRIKAVILRDCDGYHEASLLPFSCAYKYQQQSDWRGLISGLRKIDFDGHLIVNTEDAAATISPLLRTQFLALARAAAEHVAWQIGIDRALKKYDKRVLFGAGNMCRNYMKCYGDTYPPLFTCDNDDTRWGDTYCGLEIRPPEALKDLPEDCGVFICNLHYDAIQEQLEEMGIKNIERFSDEYLPFVPEDLELK